MPTLTDNKKLKEIITSERVKFAYDKFVYEIICKDNDREQCNIIYIRTTKRTLATRVGKHKKDIIKNKQTIALAQHYRIACT